MKVLSGYFIYLFLIEGSLLYSIVLVSTKHQHGSVIGLPMSPPREHPSPFHPSRLLPSPSLSFLSHTASSHWLSILHVVMYVSWLLSPSLSPSPSSLPTTSRSLCSVSVSIAALRIGSPGQQGFAERMTRYSRSENLITLKSNDKSMECCN